MAPDTNLTRRARSIFEDLGYTVRGSPTPGEFRATRAWKEVTVRAVTDPGDAGCSGGLRCFVADHDTADRLQRRLDASDIDCEYAIISVEPDAPDDYEVVRAPPTGR